MSKGSGSRHCSRRPVQWERDGAWEKIWRTLLRELDEQKTNWSRTFLNGSFVPPNRGAEVGLTRRGKGSKLMLVTDGKGLPLGLLAKSANVTEVALAEDTLAAIQAPQRRGRPKTRLGPAVKLGSYGLRWHVERSYASLPNFRRLAARYERSGRMFEAFVMIAFIILCLRRL